MKANYNKLWKLLIDKKMNKTTLQEKAGMSPNTLAKMSKDEMIEFAKYSGLDRIIYVTTGTPVVEQSKDIWVGSIIRTSMNARVIVMEADGTMVDLFSASQNGDSRSSEMRAKRDCFKKVMREIRQHIEENKGSTKKAA